MRYKVLVVDDEQDNLALLYRTLRSEYEVVKALSPLEALDILKNDNFDLIISDHKMPEMDGVEFLKRTQENAPMAMRLLVTAYSDAKILIDAINQAKIYRYIKKPYQPDELLYMVRGSLEYYQLKKDNENLIENFKELFSGTVKAITEALDAKDFFTMGQSKRVAYYSLQIAKSLNLDVVELGRIELAGLLHDIGMIGVPEDILSKIDALMPEEYEEIKKHVNYSIKILGDIKQLRDVLDIIKYHHEHWDGLGYPYGLKGEDIPLGSRIIAVADAWESLGSDRAYRKKVSEEVALAEIKQKRGTQFDPQIVDVLEKLVPNISFGLENYEGKIKNIEEEVISNQN